MCEPKVYECPSCGADLEESPEGTTFLCRELDCMQLYGREEIVDEEQSSDH